MSRTIAFDFDGVIHKYRDGWKDGSIYDEYNEEVVKVMIRLLENNYAVAILSTRDPVQISNWWNSKNFPVTAVPVINGSTFWNDTTHIGVFNKKIPAQVYIDDRGLTFNGDTTNLYDSIVKFQTYQERAHKLF